jgi:hypothetical protein
LFEAKRRAINLGIAAAGTEQQGHKRQTRSAHRSKEKNARRKGVP